MLGIWELCQWLVSHKFDVNYTSAFGRPLDCAMFRTHILSTLLPEADKNNSMDYQHDAQDCQIVRLLLDARANPDTRFRVRLKPGKTFPPLSVSVWSCRLQCTQLLLLAGATCKLNVLEA